MKKRWLACTMGIILSLSLVMTSLADVRAEEIGTDVQSQQVQAEDEEVLESMEEDEGKESAEEEIQEESEDVILEEEVSTDDMDDQTEKNSSDEGFQTMTAVGDVEAFEERTPTFENPVSKVEYIKQSDGGYLLRVTISNIQKLYASQLNQDLIKGVGVSAWNEDHTRCFMDNEDYYDGEDEFVFTASFAKNIRQGETFSVDVYFIDRDIQDSSAQRVDLGMQKVSFTAPSFIGTSSDNKVTSATPKLGFDGYPRVEIDFTGIERKYLLRVDPSTGIGILANNGNYTNYDYLEDGAGGVLDYGKTYWYYVVTLSSGSLYNKLKAGTTFAGLTSEEQTLLLSSCSTPYSVTTTKPNVAEVTDVKCTSSLESVSVTWWTTDQEEGTNATGYEVYQNNKLVKNYAERSYDGEITVNLRIPYAGVQKFKIRPYFTANGKTYYGDWSKEVSCESTKIGASSLVVVKINSNQVRIKIRSGSGITGNDVYVSYGSSWKKIKSNVRGDFTYKVKKAASKKYRVVGLRYTGGKYYAAKASAIAAPRANVKYVSHISYDPNYYAYATSRFLTTKLYYSKNKLKISGYLLNSRYFTLKKAKITVYVYSQGKLIGKQTFTNKKKIGGMKRRKLTLTFKKGKKDYDLTNATIRWKVTPTWF